MTGTAKSGSKSTFFSRVTLKFDGWPWKNNRALFLYYFKLCASFDRHLWIQTVAVAETSHSGKNRRFFCPMWPWNLTDDNNRAPLLCHIKLCKSLHQHLWIQTGITVLKRLNWVLTYLALTFDLWPWLFAWTSLKSMVITPDNLMMIRWQEHGEKGVTDWQTDGQMDGEKCSVPPCT